MLGGYGSIGDFPKVLPKIPSIIQSAAGIPHQTINQLTDWI
jgi:hypothetical protein